MIQRLKHSYPFIPTAKHNYKHFWFHADVIGLRNKVELTQELGHQTKRIAYIVFNSL